MGAKTIALATSSCNKSDAASETSTPHGIAKRRMPCPMPPPPRIREEASAAQSLETAVRNTSSSGMTMGPGDRVPAGSTLRHASAKTTEQLSVTARRAAAWSGAESASCRGPLLLAPHGDAQRKYSGEQQAPKQPTRPLMADLLRDMRRQLGGAFAAIAAAAWSSTTLPKARHFKSSSHSGRLTRSMTVRHHTTRASTSTIPNDLACSREPNPRARPPLRLYDRACVASVLNHACASACASANDLLFFTGGAFCSHDHDRTSRRHPRENS